MAERNGELTPAERSMIGRIGGHAKARMYDPVESTAAARAAGPGQRPYWEQKVDPDQTLSDSERRRRADHAKAEYFARLQLASVRARRRRASASSDGSTAA